MATTEWKVQTIGQNKKIQEIAAAAEKASALVTTNVGLASAAIKAAGVLLTGMLSPYIILLRATADAIDDFVVDFRDIGFYVLEVTDAEGGYIIPEDADGHPIKLLISPAAVAANAAIASTGGQAVQFAAWAKEFLGEEDIYLTGAQKAIYEVETGKSVPEDQRNSNAFDNKMGELDGITGLYKMTPSQVISTIVAAMDEELDPRRPNFSAEAEAGAVVVLVGISDLTKNLANLKAIVKAFTTFFGGDEVVDKNGKIKSPGGIASGMGKLGTLVGAALGQIEDPSLNDVVLEVHNVCKVRGTEEDKFKLQKTEPTIPYMIEGVFELNDMVVGPRVKFGARCQGYVSEVISTTDGDDINTPEVVENEGVYQTQKLRITALTNMDAIGFKSLSSGAKLQKVAYVTKYKTYTDQNTGITKTTGPFNDFEYLPNLPVEKEYKLVSDGGVARTYWSKSHPQVASTKVKREPGNTLLTVLEREDVREVHTFETHHGGFGKHTTHNVTVGDIKEQKKPEPKHPNFKAVKLDDLIGDFKTFFSAIDALTDAIRKMADDAEAAIEDIIKYLDEKIKELNEIAEALQKILALFTIGLGDAGVYILNIPVAIGGNDYVKAELQGASNRPPDTLEFTMAFMMMGGGAAGTEEGFKTLQKLLVP